MSAVDLVRSVLACVAPDGDGMLRIKASILVAVVEEIDAAAVVRGGEVVTLERDHYTTDEIAAVIGLKPSTVRGMLPELERAGWAVSNPSGKGWRFLKNGPLGFFAWRTSPNKTLRSDTPALAALPSLVPSALSAPLASDGDPVDLSAWRAMRPFKQAG